MNLSPNPPLPTRCDKRKLSAFLKLRHPHCSRITYRDYEVHLTTSQGIRVFAGYAPDLMKELVFIESTLTERSLAHENNHNL